LQELTTLAKDGIGWDTNQTVDFWLQKAEEFHEKALNVERNADIETTWIELIKTTEILHRLEEDPGCRKYFAESQRSSMGNARLVFAFNPSGVPILLVSFSALRAHDTENAPTQAGYHWSI
jgi:hypothetical protein